MFNPYGMQYAQPYNGLITVAGLSGANDFEMPPNSAAVLIDSTRNVMYIKTTDANGIPNLDPWDISPHVEPEPPEYVTVDAFNQFANNVYQMLGAANGQHSAGQPQTTAGDSKAEPESNDAAN